VASGESMSMVVASMAIPVAMPAADTLLRVTLAAPPLDGESVSITCTVSNIGQIELQNLVVRLPERDIVLGSVLTLNPGEEKTLTYDRLVPGELGSITAQADAVLPNGDLITVMSDPLVFGEAGAEPDTSPSPGATPEAEAQGRRRGILLPVLISVLVLGAAALAIIFWPKKKGAHAKAPKDKGGGGE